jgi:cytochrome P450
MFLIWAVSLPQNRNFQAQLIEEASNVPESSFSTDGVPSVEVGDKLPYVNATIKEALRMYAPIPSYEPRSIPVSSVVDSYNIPAGTIVGVAPCSLHRNPDVFEALLTFNPGRWLNASPERLTEMNRWWWAFSSRGRMCIGIHLAMAEMTTLVPAIYRKYRTSIAPGSEGVSPGIKSRYELFYEESFSSVVVSSIPSPSSFTTYSLPGTLVPHQIRTAWSP